LGGAMRKGEQSSSLLQLIVFIQQKQKKQGTKPFKTPKPVTKTEGGVNVGVKESNI
jgi:antirestriction protein ArdC